MMLLFINSIINTVYASAWLIDSARYRYTSTIAIIDKNSKYIKQLRADLYLQTQQRLVYLRNQLKLVNSQLARHYKLSEEIVALEKIAKNLCSYQDEIITIATIEYGITNNQNLAIQLLYKQNSFQGSKNINYRSANRLTNSEISIFYKIKLLQNDKYIISVQPRISVNKNTAHQPQLAYELLLLSGISKNFRSASLFTQNSIGFGQDLNNSYSKRNYYCFSTSEGIKFDNNILLTSFTQYSFRKNYGNIYSKTLYNQLSVAKEIKLSKPNNSSNNDLTAQIGYFWDQSLINKNYKLSGVIFSLWINW
jgi:hypothetical protein